MRREAGAESLAPISRSPAWCRRSRTSSSIINVYLRDVHTGKLVAAASVDMRGNTDESWSRATRYLIRERLLAPNFGAPPAR